MTHQNNFFGNYYMEQRKIVWWKSDFIWNIWKFQLAMGTIVLEYLGALQITRKLYNKYLLVKREGYFEDVTHKTNYNELKSTTKNWV